MFLIKIILGGYFMNCFIETRKVLKRNLKQKLNISLATIVGFLITGTVAVAAWEEKPTGDNVITVTTKTGTWTVNNENGSGTFYGNNNTHL